MLRALAILPALLLAVPALAQGSGGGTQRCERDFRQCSAECGAGPAGACVATCYEERAMCIQNPSRPPQRPAR
jgi:hypothetical protein